MIQAQHPTTAKRQPSQSKMNLNSLRSSQPKQGLFSPTLSSHFQGNTDQASTFNNLHHNQDQMAQITTPSTNQIQSSRINQNSQNLLSQDISIQSSLRPQQNFDNLSSPTQHSHSVSLNLLSNSAQRPSTQLNKKSTYYDLQKQFPFKQSLEDSNSNNQYGNHQKSQSSSRNKYPINERKNQENQQNLFFHQINGTNNNNQNFEQQRINMPSKSQNRKDKPTNQQLIMQNQYYNGIGRISNTTKKDEAFMQTPKYLTNNNGNQNHLSARYINGSISKQNAFQRKQQNTDLFQSNLPDLNSNILKQNLTAESKKGNFLQTNFQSRQNQNLFGSLTPNASRKQDINNPQMINYQKQNFMNPSNLLNNQLHTLKIPQKQILRTLGQEGNINKNATLQKQSEQIMQQLMSPIHEAQNLQRNKKIPRQLRQHSQGLRQVDNLHEQKIMYLTNYKKKNSVQTPNPTKNKKPIISKSSIKQQSQSRVLLDNLSQSQEDLNKKRTLSNIPFSSKQLKFDENSENLQLQTQHQNKLSNLKSNQLSKRPSGVSSKKDVNFLQQSDSSLNSKSKNCNLDEEEQKLTDTTGYIGGAPESKKSLQNLQYQLLSIQEKEQNVDLIQDSSRQQSNQQANGRNQRQLTLQILPRFGQRARTQEDFPVVKQIQSDNNLATVTEQNILTLNKVNQNQNQNNPLLRNQNSLTRNPSQPRQKITNDQLQTLVTSNTLSPNQSEKRDTKPNLYQKLSRDNSQTSLIDKSSSGANKYQAQKQNEANQQFGFQRENSTGSLAQAKLNYLRRTTITGGFIGGAFRSMRTKGGSISSKFLLIGKVNDIKAKFEKNHSVDESDKNSDSLGSIISSSSEDSRGSKKSKVSKQSKQSKQRRISKRTNAVNTDEDNSRRQSKISKFSKEEIMRRRRSTVMTLKQQPTQELFENFIFESVFKNDINMLREVINSITTVAERCKRINQVDKNQRTAIFYAVFHQNYEIVSYLLSQGADTLFIDQNQRTILHYACIFGASRNLVQLILDYNSQMDTGNSHSLEGLKSFTQRKINQNDMPKRGYSVNRPQLIIEVDSFANKDSKAPKQQYERLQVDIQQPMTSLMPKKKKGLDASKLSVIKDDVDAESNASASAATTNAQKQNLNSPFLNRDNLKLNSFGLSNPLENKLLMKRQQTKKPGVLRSGSSVTPGSVGNHTNKSGNMSSISSQVADERSKYNLEVQVKKSRQYQRMNKSFINTVDKDGKTAYFHACKKGNLQLIKLLFDRGAIPITRDSQSRKPLDVAQTQEIFSLISQHEGIFEGRFSKSLRTHHKSMILDDFDSIRKKQFQINTKLFKKNVNEEIKEIKGEEDLESIDNIKTNSPAPKTSNEQGLRISRKSQLNKEELASWSDNLLVQFQIGLYKDNVLTYKMRFDDQDNFEYLLRRQLPISLYNKDGNNLIHYAIQLEKYKFLTFMLEGTFQSELYDKSLILLEDSMFDIYLNQYAQDLYNQIEYQQQPWISEALYALEKCNQKEGNSVIHMAIDIGNLQLFCYLICMFKIRDQLKVLNEIKYEKVFKPFSVLLEFKNKHQLTPLLYSSKRNQYKIFQALLVQGSQLYTSCSKFMNPLHYAVLNDNIQMIEQIVFCDAETDKLLHEQNYRNQTPDTLDEKKKYQNIFNHIWKCAAICNPTNMETLEQQLNSERFSVNSKTLIGQNTALHIAVINENQKAIDYLCKQPDVNIQERNSLGQTPCDLALLIPKKRTASRIIDIFNKKILIQNQKEKSNLSPAFTKNNNRLLLKKSTFNNKNSIPIRQRTHKFSIVPRQTNSLLHPQAENHENQSTNNFNSINFDFQIRNFVEQMGRIVVGIERSNSIVGKKISTTSLDSSEGSGDFLDEESSFGSNMFLTSQASFGIDDFRGLNRNNKDQGQNSKQKQNWEPHKVQKLLRIYENFIEKQDLIGNFNPEIFVNWKSILLKQDDSLIQRAKDLFKQLDEKKKGVVHIASILKNKQMLLSSKILNDIQYPKYLEFINKNYSDSKITEKIFVNILIQVLQEKGSNINSQYNSQSNNQNDNNYLQ